MLAWQINIRLQSNFLLKCIYVMQKIHLFLHSNCLQEVFQGTKGKGESFRPARTDQWIVLKADVVLIPVSNPRRQRFLRTYHLHRTCFGTDFVLTSRCCAEDFLPLSSTCGGAGPCASCGSWCQQQHVHPTGASGQRGPSTEQSLQVCAAFTFHGCCSVLCSVCIHS